jgi:hypothetical protein
MMYLVVPVGSLQVVSGTRRSRLLAAALVSQYHGSAFGPATRDFLWEVARVAGAHASADLYHLSAMVWGEHWQQRLSLVLARGQASLVLGAVAAASNNATGASGRKASPEFSETDCQPAKRQPVRAGECTTHPVPTPHFDV